jgi:hypothetical protein
MKKINYYFTILLFFNITFCFAQSVLNNKSIIALSKAGLPSSIIINKVKTSTCSFDLSTDALIELKDNKVPDDVLNAMIDKQGMSTATGNPVADNIIGKLSQTGIYYFEDLANHYIKVDPSIVTGGKTGANMLGTIKSKSILDGAESNLQTTKSPVFYFYFGDNSESKLSSTNASNIAYKNEFVQMLQSYTPNAKTGNTAFTPNDFKLIKLDKSRNNRSFESGRISMYSGASSGVSKNIQGFKYEAITSNLYKVYFPTGLSDGEYCFIYASSAASGGVTASLTNSIYHNTDIKVFDFGVKKQ